MDTNLDTYDTYYMCVLLRITIYFILTEIFRYRSHEKLMGKFLHAITIAKRLSHKREKRFIQSKISCQNESVSLQRVHVVVGASSDLHSPKFVEFPQVYSRFITN